MAAGSLVLTMLAQTGVIILELNHPDEAVVYAYAVTFQTGTFVVILATATNRLYAPRISALLERGDFQALRTMARYRLLVIAPLTLGYCSLLSPSVRPSCLCLARTIRRSIRRFACLRSAPP
jgi:O-antigen/teichoic acid export membrane protein